MRDKYIKQVALLLRVMPEVYKVQEFAVHGGTAINLFHKNGLRYSVDLDLTYIPIQDRTTSLATINKRLLEIKRNLEMTIPHITVTHSPATWKLLCSLGDVSIKIEVNGTKRGLIGDPVEVQLCPKIKEEFSTNCKARTVSLSQLYGGKIMAALSRQHPRDLFDCKYMDVKSFEEIKDGFMLNLLGGEKPTIELLQPNEIEQREALESQFEEMTEISFSYDDFLLSRRNLIDWVNGSLTEMDKEFLFSFEQGEPDWGKCCAGDLSLYPSVKWKLLNLNKLKNTNPQKLQREADRLKETLGVG